ncbi:MAG: AMP-binding protein [Elusimicrobiota bacterium]|jgi:acyl-[acyl-carrier-protein]-phospholipid O-acyltransferase/long-chain-fatty-acid--[acyl-carrier-protein] ligase
MTERPSLGFLLARTLARIFVFLLYRMRIIDRRHCPRKGAALLVANHISYADPILIAAASPRSVHFLMSRTYFDIPVARWFFKAMGAIPVSGRDSPKAVLRSLEACRKVLREGNVLCIFAEGTISRHGQMNSFKKGFEKVVQGLDVPIVPVHLDRLWGSLFSFEGGRVLFKLPGRLPYPVTVNFGHPLPPDADAHRVRQAIQELGSESFRLRLAEKDILPVGFVRRARRHPFRLALAGSGGRSLNYGSAYAAASCLARALEPVLGPGKRQAVMLPASLEGALAVLALSLSGRTPVMLGLSLSRESAAARMSAAGAGKVVTSRKLAARLGWEPEGAVFLEDLPKPGLSGLLGGWLRLLFRDPAALAPPGAVEDEAAVLFTSGSTGLPKGVVLSHANILANVEAVSQVYATLPGDRVLGVLTLHHALGFTGTLWLPLLLGFGAVFHHDPTDAASVAKLAERFRASILIATPAMLSMYLRRVPPRAFRSLRLVVAGADKLREDLAAAWLTRFGVLPLEGYGSTELSPVAAVNIPDVVGSRGRQKGGKLGTIGRPLPGVTLKTVSPETWEPTPEGVPGLLLVKGPSVMKGYIGGPEPTSEVMRDGWYVTGDAAVIDEDGFVTITDRLSRFSRIGNEMVPHRALETALQDLSGTAAPVFLVSSVPDRDGERLVVLHAGDCDVEDLRVRLAATGFPKPWIPDAGRFHRVDKLPIALSGKVDLVALKALAVELDA